MQKKDIASMVNRGDKAEEEKPENKHDVLYQDMSSFGGMCVREGERDLKRGCNYDKRDKVTQLVSGRVGIQTQGSLQIITSFHLGFSSIVIIHLFYKFRQGEN